MYIRRRVGYTHQPPLYDVRLDIMPKLLLSAYRVFYGSFCSRATYIIICHLNTDVPLTAAVGEILSDARGRPSGSVAGRCFGTWTACVSSAVAAASPAASNPRGHDVHTGGVDKTRLLPCTEVLFSSPPLISSGDFPKEFPSTEVKRALLPTVVDVTAAVARKIVVKIKSGFVRRDGRRPRSSDTIARPGTKGPKRLVVGRVGNAPYKTD